MRKMTLLSASFVTLALAFYLVVQGMHVVERTEGLREKRELAKAEEAARKKAARIDAAHRLMKAQEVRVALGDTAQDNQNLPRVGLYMGFFRNERQLKSARDSGIPDEEFVSLAMAGAAQAGILDEELLRMLLNVGVSDEELYDAGLLKDKP